MTGYPLTNYDHISDLLKDPTRDTVHISKNGMFSEGPIIFHAEFDITNDEIYDTYLDMSGWAKVRLRNKFKRQFQFYFIFHRALPTLMVLISEDIGRQ